jgi:hypothetical protein
MKRIGEKRPPATAGKPFAKTEAVKKLRARRFFVARERSLSLRSMLLFLPSVFWPLRFLNLAGG